MHRKKPILLAEDNRVDVMAVRRALKELKVMNRLDVVGNGEEALKFLRDPKNERPCMIILDLNMPQMDGIEFLKVAKKDKKLKIIPVVVLTSFKEEREKVRSLHLGMAGYMLKPVDCEQFVEVMRTIDLYWTLSDSRS